MTPEERAEKLTTPKPFDWADRYRYSRIAARHIARKFGKEYAEYWVWNETPVPFDLPSWDQIAEALGR